jgi:hypothetical protein
MLEVVETELLRTALRPLRDQRLAVVDTLDDTEAEAVRQALAGVLLEEAEAGTVGRRHVALVVPPGFKSILYRREGDDGVSQVVVFNLQDAATETAISLLGVLVAVFTGSWSFGTVISAAGVAKTLWSKLKVLRRPEDAEAIEALEALARARAKLFTAGHNEAPSTAQIEAEAMLPAEALRRALGRLKTLRVIEVARWAGQAEDMAPPGTTWKIAL